MYQQLDYFMPHILLIDDDSKLMALLCLAFERAAYYVSVASDGHTNLSMAPVENPDVILHFRVSSSEMI